MKWSVIPACPSIMCSFSMGNIEGTNTSIFFIWCLCMYVLFYVCKVIGFVEWLDRGFIYRRRVLKCAFSYDLRLTVLRWPCVVNRTLKPITTTRHLDTIFGRSLNWPICKIVWCELRSRAQKQKTAICCAVSNCLPIFCSWSCNTKIGV